MEIAILALPKNLFPFWALSKVLNLKFPEEYHSREVAGKDVEFTVTLKELKKKILPALDDEFAKSLGSHETLEALKTEIAKDVQDREEKRVKEDLRKNRHHHGVDHPGDEAP